VLSVCIIVAEAVLLVLSHCSANSFKQENNFYIQENKRLKVEVDRLSNENEKLTLEIEKLRALVRTSISFKEISEKLENIESLVSPPEGSCLPVKAIADPEILEYEMRKTNTKKEGGDEDSTCRADTPPGTIYLMPEPIINFKAEESFYTITLVYCESETIANIKLADARNKGLVDAFIVKKIHNLPDRKWDYVVVLGKYDKIKDAIDRKDKIILYFPDYRNSTVGSFSSMLSKTMYF